MLRFLAFGAISTAPVLHFPAFRPLPKAPVLRFPAFRPPPKPPVLRFLAFGTKIRRNARKRSTCAFAEVETLGNEGTGAVEIAFASRKP